MLEKILPLLKTGRTNIKLEEEFMLIQGALGVLAILPFAAMRFLQGDWWLGTVDLLIVMGMVSLGVYGSGSVHFRKVSMLFTLIYTSGMLAVISLKGADMLFWSYPTAVAGYFMVRLKEAIIISAISVCCIVFLVSDILSTFQLSSFVVTYFLVCLFACIFAARMAYDKKTLSDQATIDPLTGANNRRALDDAMNSRMLLSRQQDPVSIVIFDIDYFKRINDEYGHAVGDVFLQRFVTFLQDIIRKNEKLFRFGGEEFVVLAEGGLEDATSLAEQVRILLEESELIREHRVTVSVGVAELGELETAREWMKRADDALYKAKYSGRNRVCQADPPEVGRLLSDISELQI